MKKLLKAYGFNSDMQYFERIVFLLLHNDRKASILMFSDMSQKDRKMFCKAVTGEWQSGLNIRECALFIDLI